MPAVGLTSSLIKRRRRHHGSATSNRRIGPPTPRTHHRSPPSRPAPRPRRVAATTVLRGPRSVSAPSPRAVRRHQRSITRGARQARRTTRFKRAQRAVGYDPYKAAVYTRRQRAKATNITRRAVRRYGRSRAPVASGINRRKAAAYAIQQVEGRTYTPPSDPIGAQLESLAPTGLSIIRALTGDEPGATTPTLSEVGNLALALAPIPAAKGALATRALLRGEKGLKTAQRVERTTKAAEEAGKARKAETAAQRVSAGSRAAKVKATAKGVGREARAQLGSLERQARRAQRQDRAVRAATNPALAATSASPSDIGDRTRAFIEGTVTANPKKSIETTGRSIPASLGFLADVGGALGATGVRATQEGLAAAGLPGGHEYSGSEITAPIRGVASQVPEIVESLGPLVSGDPEAVRKATESDLGYVFAPLLPRGAISRPVRAVGRGARDVATRAGRALDRAPTGTTEVGSLRGIRQRMGPTGRATRKRVAGLASDEVQPEHFYAARREHEMDKALGRRSRGKPVRDLVGVLADYGIARDHAPEQLRMVRDTIERTHGEGVPEGFSLPVDAVTTSRALRFAEQHPEVLESPRLWQAVETYKAGAKEVETSPVAKYREQARVLDVQAPETRVPLHARKFTAAETRGEAWQDVEGARSQVKDLRDRADSLERQAGPLRVKVQQRETMLARKVRKFSKPETRARKIEEAKRADTLLNRQRAQLLEVEANARGLRAEAKALSNRAKNLHATLKPYTHPDVTPSPQLKSIGWDAALAHEFLDEVRSAGARHGFAEPAWTRHADLRHVLDGDIPVRQHGKPTGTQHIKTGKSEAADMVDRSYDAFVRGSIYFPRMRNAVARFTRRFIESEAKTVPIDGKVRTVITRDQWNRAVREGLIDPREHVLLPANQWGNAIKHGRTDLREARSAEFDLKDFHSQVVKHVEEQVTELADARGTKYVVVSREAAREFADQINPVGGRIEKFLSGTGTLGSRAILGFSPAWAMVQIGAEGLQMLAAVSSPRRLARAVEALRKGAEHDRKGYEGFTATAGESAGFQQPRAHRVSMGPQTQGFFANAYRAMGRTAFGEALFKAGTGELLSQFDRFKGGKFRSIVLAAQVDRQLNGFVEGLRGATKIQRKIAEELQGKPLHEQITRLGRDPKLRKLLLQHKRYLDDVMGNFHAYTRYERQFGPLGIFYPYVRMSFRWTLWTYPTRHPIKAQMLYLAGQQHAEDVEKLLGAPPDWIHYGDPIIYDKDAKKGAVAILPIGQRISPGLNAFMESVGEGNVAGIVRGANPFIGTAFYGVSGINPLSGEQDAKTLTEHGLLVLNQLLSMPAPVRALKLNKVGAGPQSEVSKAFAEADPQRQLRSNVFPYLPQSVKSAKQYNDLSILLDNAFGGYEITVPETDAQKAARSEYESRFGSGATSSESSGGGYLGTLGGGSSSSPSPAPSSGGNNPYMDVLGGGSTTDEKNPYLSIVGGG